MNHFIAVTLSELLLDDLFIHASLSLLKSHVID